MSIASRPIESQPAQVRKKCEELARIRNCTIEKVWEKVSNIRKIARLTPKEAVSYCLEVAKTQQRSGKLESW